MNCPQCGNRNPSDAKRCLHCNAVFEEEREGLFDTSGDDGGSGMVMIFGGAIAVVVLGSMFLFGFDTYDAKCVHSESAAAEYEAKPDWERDESGERRYHDREERRYRERHGRRMSSSMHEEVWCFRKKTGHVDGAVE